MTLESIITPVKYHLKTLKSAELKSAELDAIRNANDGVAALSSMLYYALSEQTMSSMPEADRQAGFGFSLDLYKIVTNQANAFPDLQLQHFRVPGLPRYPLIMQDKDTGTFSLRPRKIYDVCIDKKPAYFMYVQSVMALSRPPSLMLTEFRTLDRKPNVYVLLVTLDAFPKDADDLQRRLPIVTNTRGEPYTWYNHFARIDLSFEDADLPTWYAGTVPMLNGAPVKHLWIGVHQSGETTRRRLPVTEPQRVAAHDVPTTI